MFAQLYRLAGVNIETLNRLSPDTASLALQETLPSAEKPIQLLTTGNSGHRMPDMGLTWGAVDFRKREIAIRSETSKGRRDRTLPFSDQLLYCLQAWREAYASHSAEDLVLP